MSKKIILLPLDDRPCNASYPHHIGLPTGLLITPPSAMLGYKKNPGSFDALKEWLLREVKTASHLVLSIDQLVYGGLIPSRLHHLDKETLKSRLDLVYDIKKANPRLVILAFVMIMRNPFYNSSDEEPDYYEYDGSNIYKSGYYPHKLELLGALSVEEKADYDAAMKSLNKHNLGDYLTRRSINLEIVKSVIELQQEEIIDYLVIPQDDSSPFGYTKRDQLEIIDYIKLVGANHIDIYPGADEVGLVLIARAVQNIFKTKKKIELIFACNDGKYEIPPFEDRPLIQSVNSQISASGSTLEESGMGDIKLFINVASRFLDSSQEGYEQAFFVDRHLPAFIDQIQVALENDACVALADVAFANGGEQALLKGLDEKGLCLKLAAYGGWNTSSNTLGTVIAQAIIYHTFKLTEKNRYFLLHRFYEDVGYMNHVRREIVEHHLPSLGLNYFDSGAIRGEVSRLVEKTLLNYMKDNFPQLASHVSTLEVRHPWQRMFEIDLSLSLVSATKVALDIGGTYIKAGRIKDGQLLDFVKVPTCGSLGREAIMANVEKVISRLLNDEVTGISISSAGDIDPFEGKCTFASSNLMGWTGFNLKNAVENKYHLLTYVDNDAYCHLNAERRAYPNTKNITLITLGTGVGGASLVNGKLDRTLKTKWGYRVIVPGGRALEGAPEDGVSEAYLAVRNLMSAINPVRGIYSVKKLFMEYQKGHSSAQRILKDYGKYLNLLLHLINEEIKPDMIILGGGLTSNKAVMQALIDETIDNYAFATSGNDAGMIGAYYLPIEEN